MKLTRTMVATLCAQACAVPVAPSAEGPSDLHFQLSARDALGREAPLDAVVRRPEFRLSSARPLAPVELLLIAGEADADLLEDLAGLPLRAANLRRIVPSYTLQQGAALRLAPQITLPKDTPYTLALPGSARERDGAALGDGGPAFVAQLRTSAEPGAGAAWLATLPAPRQRQVPVNLEAVFVALDGDLEVTTRLDEALWLEGPDATAVPAEVERVACSGVDTRAVSCAQLTPGGALAPGARYVVRSGRGLRDARGAPVEPLAAAFETAGGPDRRAPGFEPVGCLPDEIEADIGCLMAGDTWVEVTLRCDESVRVEAARGEPASSPEPRAPPESSEGITQLSTAQLAAGGDASLRLFGLDPDAAFSLTLTATDLAGNSSEVHVTGSTAAPLATLSITEVLADPDGADAQKEYVELWNFGPNSVALRGVSLADGSGKASVVASEVELAPDARALLVSDDFELPSQPSAATAPSRSAAFDARDVVPAGVRLVRVGPSLTKGGIANAGEALYLRDAAGHRLSAAPARATAAGLCLARVSTDPRGGAAEDFTRSRCTPGQ